MPSSGGLPVGLYEQLVTKALADRLAADAETMVVDDLDPGDASSALARHIAALLARLLRDLPEAHRQSQAVDIANALLADLRRLAPTSFDGDDDFVAPPPRVLREVLGPPLPDGRRLSRESPTIPLSTSALLVNARGEPAVGNAVNRELASADHVDLLVPFVRWTGVRIVREPLAEVVARGGRVRVIASTYLGSSETRALDALVALGAEVRVSYDTTATRLHAKALAVRARLRLLDRPHRLLEPLQHRAHRRTRVERPALGDRDRLGARRLPRNLRGLLGE
jgi:hypothetical protein